MKEETYRHIIREKISTQENMEKLCEDRALFIKYQKLFCDMRMAYGHGMITQEELMTLRGQIKAGDGAGAKAGFDRMMLERSGAFV